jgi:FAD:protein FMN transferase
VSTLAHLPSLLLTVAALALPLWTTSCVREAEEAPPATATAQPKPAEPAKAARMIVRTRKCMGTECTVKAFATDDALVDRASTRGFDEMARIEALVTSWRDSSEISQVNEAAGVRPVKVSPETLAILDKALWVAEKTKGGFDVTVGVYKGLWKFDEDNDGTIPRKSEVEKRRKLVNYKDVVVDKAAGTVMLRRKGQRLNVEGLAKGYAVDAAVRVIRDAGLENFIIQAGGDLFASGRRGQRDWRVGIQDPRGPHGRIIYELSLSNRAFNTSGDYERFTLHNGVRYHHILDARTGYPSHAARAVTLLADTAFEADAFDTAIFILGPEAGMKLVNETAGLQAVIVGPDNQVHISDGLKDRLVKRGDPSPGL